MKRTVVCLLILALVLVWPVGAMAAGEETVTTTGGEETVAVKEIHTVEDLQAVANDPDGSYILMENLDLAGVEWKPLDFRGTFDGNGKAVLNLTLTQPGDERDISYDGNIKEYDTTFVGFFGTLRNATVKNLQLLNVRTVTQMDVPVFVGGMAGFSQGSTISDCTVTGCMELRAHDRMFGIAGVVGYGTGTVENCTVDVTLICTDTDPNTKDEQFLGGVFSTGFMDVFNCKVNIDGYVSEFGYCHNGGIVGMNMQKPLGEGRCGRLNGNSVTGKITFFEMNEDRRAYCRPIAGETLATWVDYSGNTSDFQRDERKEFDTELRPEMCEAPTYAQVVTEPGCDSFGYTVYTCNGCGYSYSDHYTLPAHKITNWVVTKEPTVEQEGESIANCDDCGMAFTRTEEKLPPPPETEPVETTEAATTPAENSGNYGSPQEQRTLLIVALLLVLGICAGVVLVIVNRKRKK